MIIFKLKFPENKFTLVFVIIGETIIEIEYTFCLALFKEL